MREKTLDFTKARAVYNDWILPTLSTGLYFFLLFCANHFVFWGVEQLHYNWCTGRGLYGFFQSMLTNQSGVCSAFRRISGLASSSGTQVLYAVIGLIASKLYNSERSQNPVIHHQGVQPVQPITSLVQPVEPVSQPLETLDAPDAPDAPDALDALDALDAPDAPPTTEVEKNDVNLLFV